MKQNDIESELNENIEECSWNDCLGRKISWHTIGIEEIKNMIQDNINNHPDVQESTDRDFSRKNNIFIKEIIEKYKQSIINTTPKVNTDWVNKIKKYIFIKIITIYYRFLFSQIQPRKIQFLCPAQPMLLGLSPFCTQGRLDAWWLPLGPDKHGTEDGMCKNEMFSYYTTIESNTAYIPILPPIG